MTGIRWPLHNLAAGLCLLVLDLGNRAMACPTCIGDAGKDRVALLTSMMVLFIITVGVLVSFGAFFFYIQRRSLLYRSDASTVEDDERGSAWK